MGKTGSSAFAIYQQRQRKPPKSLTVAKKQLKKKSRLTLETIKGKESQRILDNSKTSKADKNSSKKSISSSRKEKSSPERADNSSKETNQSSEKPRTNYAELLSFLMKICNDANPSHSSTKKDKETIVQTHNLENNCSTSSLPSPIPKLNTNKSEKWPVEVEKSTTKPKKVKLSNDHDDVPFDLQSRREIFNEPENIFRWMITPLVPSNFFKSYWEKKFLHIKRKNRLFYDNILSTSDLDAIFRNNSLFFTRNVDVVSYEDGKRETHNLEGRAFPAQLWDYYENGCSIRVLNPQTYCPKLHLILAALQEYFGCMAGVNCYLTPPDSQGFAPHYDDIEAFVLQLEGRKHWKLYAPLSPEEVLPRFSSKNFDPAEIGEPIKEVTLEAGDLLYFPRGIIHEGRTDSEAHSLHLTISVYQKTAYVDLLEHMFKSALLRATQLDVEFRKGLPLHYLRHVGYIHENKSSSERTHIVDKAKTLFSKLVDYISVDSAADELGKQFMHDCMPPVPGRNETRRMVLKDGDTIENGIVSNQAEIRLNVKIRLLRYNCLRMTRDEEDKDNIRIYYCTDNAKYYHGEEQQFLVVDKEFGSAIARLVETYPNYIEVDSLPLESDTDKIQIIGDLWERGLLVTEHPLKFYKN